MGNSETSHMLAKKCLVLPNKKHMPLKTTVTPKTKTENSINSDFNWEKNQTSYRQSILIRNRIQKNRQLQFTYQ